MVVELQEFVSAAPGLLPREWIKSDAVFESFALVNRHDANRVLIAFQTQLVLFFCLVRL